MAPVRRPEYPVFHTRTSTLTSMADARPISNWKAIAAMAENRAIGLSATIPWHLPEDFKWFKSQTLGHIVVMGRKTFESLGKPLPKRLNLVLTRHPETLKTQHPAIFGTARTGSTMMARADTQLGLLDDQGVVDVRLATSLEVVANRRDACTVFVCGGAQVYEQALPRCSELLLTRVKRTVDGDAFFPSFEHLFDPAETVRDTPEFRIERWIRKK